jgi:hypothetical protein
VERQAAQLAGGEPGPFVALGGERFDPIAVDRDERELDGDEERRGEDQSGDDAETERGFDGADPFSGFARGLLNEG